MKPCLSCSPKETGQIVIEKILPILLKKRSPQLNVLSLRGDLGSGKTTIARILLRNLGVRGRITSPTFTLIKKYKLRHPFFKTAYHIDCYRLQNPKDILSLGFGDIVKNSDNLIIIEWPELIYKNLPKKSLFQIIIEHGQKDKERIIRLLNK